MLYVVPMGELVVLILIDAGAVPGLYAEVRGRFRAQGPEGNGFKAGESRLHAASGGWIEDGYGPGIQPVKEYSIMFKHFPAQGQDAAL